MATKARGTPVNREGEASNWAEVSCRASPNLEQGNKQWTDVLLPTASLARHLANSKYSFLLAVSASASIVFVVCRLIVVYDI